MKKNKKFRITLPTLKILKVFIDNPGEILTGSDIMKRTNLSSGTTYPILLRLEAAGWFKSEWEVNPSTVGRPRKRFYQITSDGLDFAQKELNDINKPNNLEGTVFA